MPRSSVPRFTQPHWRHRRSFVVSAGAAALVLAGLTAATTPSTAVADPRLLIGMGDSYSTAAGVPPMDARSATCPGSTHAYSLVAADELGFEGRNVACGGAVLSDFTTTSRRGSPPQITDIDGADVIAFTIGGNDVGGPNGVLDSSRSPATMADFAIAVDALAPQLVNAYGEVRRSAPAAEIFALGYPDIVPRTQAALQSCLGARASGLSAPDIHYSVDLLNAAIAEAAVAAGIVFVPTTASFLGHEMCTAQPYSNGPADLNPASPGAAMHPNELGHLVLAAELLAAIGGDEPGLVPGAPPARQPVPPPTFDPESSQPVGVLTPYERAVARAVVAALLDRIRATVGPDGSG